MPHKVGLHLLHHPAASRIIPLIEKLRPAVIKSLGSAAYLANLADTLAGKKNGRVTNPPLKFGYCMKLKVEK
jgi:hypothetical protein